MAKGITKRWILNILSVIIFIIICIVLCLSFVIVDYYYSSVEQTISYRFTELDRVFTDVNSDTTTDFLTLAQSYIEDFPDKGKLEIQSLNSVGRVTLTSTGFIPDETEKMPDLDMALKNSSKSAITTSELSSGENILAGTKVITNTDGTIVGAIRYVTSVGDINFSIAVIISIVSLVALLIILCVVLSGRFFIRSIVGPI